MRESADSGLNGLDPKWLAAAQLFKAWKERSDMRIDLGEDSYPGVICGDCGEKHGRRPEGNPHATWYPGTCDVCGEEGYVTEPRDFGHLKDSWRIKQDD